MDDTNKPAQGAAWEEYKPLEFQPGQHVEACPVCGAAASLWQYSESETAPTSKAVCCVNGDAFGPQDGIVNEGCLLYSLDPTNNGLFTVRGQACWLGVGGYNAEHVDAQAFHEKIVWGIGHLLKSASPVPSPAVEGWMPIATAPKDGSEFLAYRRGAIATASRVPRDDCEMWVFGGYSAAVECWPDIKPTHWMPLPPPPLQPQAGDAA
jgi:hypothetical protein